MHIDERRRAQNRAEGQRKRIIALLEELGDIESRDQCERCGEWFKSLSAHQPHCEA